MTSEMQMKLWKSEKKISDTILFVAQLTYLVPYFIFWNQSHIPNETRRNLNLITPHFGKISHYYSFYHNYEPMTNKIKIKSVHWLSWLSYSTLTPWYYLTFKLTCTEELTCIWEKLWWWKKIMAVDSGETIWHIETETYKFSHKTQVN